MQIGSITYLIKVGLCDAKFEGSKEALHLLLESAHSIARHLLALFTKSDWSKSLIAPHEVDFGLSGAGSTTTNCPTA